MFNARDARSFDQFRIIRLVHVIERSGLAMAGAMSGTFVAAQLARIDVTPFESIGFIASMIVIGTIGFYLGIDIPRLPARASDRRRLDPVELLSAAGTFLAAIAALISVYGLVFDIVPQPIPETVIGSWWVLGVIMQTAAGALGRLRLARRVAA